MSINEKDILLKAKNGDQNAFEQIIISHQDRLYNAILHMIGNTDDASELTQEVFTKAIGSINNFRGDCQLYSWLFCIANNLVITFLRHKQRHPVCSLNMELTGQEFGLINCIESNIESPYMYSEYYERNQLVLDALKRIDDDFRILLVMRDIEGFSYKQMAVILGIKVGTLKSKLFRARDAFRNEMTDYILAE